MYHSTTEDSVKKHVLDSFSRASGDIRVLFCTIAFGMGVNCENLTRMYHFGPSEGLDDYVQESGRGGRGGEQCHAVLVKYRGCTRHKVNQEMKSYMENGRDCRRLQLLKPFGVTPTLVAKPHMCSDICAKVCLCDGSKCGDPLYGKVALLSPNNIPAVQQVSVCKHISPEMRQKLSTNLFEFRSDLIQQKFEGAALYSGEDLTCGIPKGSLKRIVEDCEFIHNLGMLERNYILFNHAASIWKIFVNTVGPCTCQIADDTITDGNSTTDSSDSDEVVGNYMRGVLFFSSESD